jgi:hypothetical protein
MIDFWAVDYNYYNDEITKFIFSPLLTIDENIKMSSDNWTNKRLDELEKINDNF